MTEPGVSSPLNPARASHPAVASVRSGRGKRPARGGSRSTRVGPAPAPPGPKVLTPRQQAYVSSVASKAAWDKKTFQWQQRLFDGAVSVPLLAEAAEHLTRTDYEEVVEERVSDKLCGYPLCAKPVIQTKGRYRISRKDLKVYDMTHLKSFCSAPCAAASDFFHEQLSDEPVYVRPTRSVPIEVVPVVFTENGATLETTVTPISRDYLISLHVQSLLETLPKVVANNIVVREKQINEAPTPPVPLIDEKISATDIEGYAFELRKSKPKHKKEVPNQIQSVTEDLERMQIHEPESEATALLRQMKELSLMGIGGSSPAVSSPTVVVTDPTGTAVQPPKVRKPTTPASRVMMKDTITESMIDDEPPSDSSARKHERDTPATSSVAPPPTKRKVKLGVEISLFGRIFTTLGRLVTRETKAYLATPDAPFPAPRDDQSSSTRKAIFSNRVATTFRVIRRDFQLQAILNDDLGALISTFLLTDSTVVLAPDEQWVLCVVFIKALCARSAFLAREVDHPAKWEALLNNTGVSMEQFQIFSDMFR
ncbi:RNA polymerase II associated protein 2 [Thoreauomyces humboldtii]|nr:RNA polymerase II associated protein 2 [Thoreauomyces humboldtii]